MLEAVLRLSYCRGIGPRLGKELLSRLKKPEALFSADPDELEISPHVARRLRDPKAVHAAAREITEAKKRGFTLIPYGSPDYPEFLGTIPDPPLVLRIWGELRRDDQLAVAIVGTRRASSYGRRQAARFARELSGAGLVIISGLARGIDGIAHEEALREGARTVAVLGSGLARIYPPEHASLAARITRQGAVISELPSSTPPLSHHFPQRNRIIAGLSLGVLVIEGGKKSGAIITAGYAADQGRLVFAVPGQVDAPGAQGVNELLRDGAALAATPGDVLEELRSIAPIGPAAEAAPSTPDLTEQEERVLACIPLGAVDPDDVAEKLGLPVGDAMATLTSLELKGCLRRYGESLERLR